MVLITYQLELGAEDRRHVRADDNGPSRADAHDFHLAPTWGAVRMQDAHGNSILVHFFQGHQYYLPLTAASVVFMP